MEFFEREYLISRILSGQLKWGASLICPPNLDLQYYSQEIFKKAIEKGRNAEMLSSDDLTELSIEKGFITEADSLFIGFAEKEVEQFQKELYLNRGKADNVRRIKKLIYQNRCRHSSILDRINKYNSFTYEGYANYCKLDYLIRNTTFKNGKKYPFKKNSIQKAINFYISNMILPYTIRYLSRTQPWSNMWSAYKANGVVFPQGCQMTQQQQLLLMWSRMYDSINESPDCPEDSVIEDDDMLDGWLLIQQENSKKDNKSGIENSKIAQAQEQYIVANNIEEARAIDSRNDPSSLKIKKQRNKVIQSKGLVLENELPDVRKKLIIERNKASMDKNAR